MSNNNYACACGLYCGDCEFLNKTCEGCSNVKGKPFWTKTYNIEVCPIYDCCVNQKQLEHCGFCEELPCKIFLNLRDPALSDKEFQVSINQRYVPR